MPTASLRIATLFRAMLLSTVPVAGPLVSAHEPDPGTDAATGFALSQDGVPIAYEVRGDGGPTLVFVHGWVCDRHYWDTQMQAFAANHRVVAIDLAGHGDSGRRRAAWTITAFGKDVAAVLERLQIDDAVLIGHSMGGDVVVSAALRSRARVRGLVWVDVYSQLRTFRTPAQIDAFMAPFRADFAATTRTFVRGMFAPQSDPALVQRVAEAMASAPRDMALGALLAVRSADRATAVALRMLPVPVVAINALGPSLDPASLREHGVELTTLDGAGHFPMLEAPDRFNAELSRAVARIAAGTDRR